MTNPDVFVWGNNDPLVPGYPATHNGAELTRRLIPRDFGISARINSQRGYRSFTSPARVARGILFAQTPKNIRRRLDAYATAHSLNPDELREEFMAGLSQDDTYDLLWVAQQHPKEVITGVQPTKIGWRATIRAGRDKTIEALVRQSSSEPRFLVAGHSTSTDYGFNLDNHAQATDIGLAALEWALFFDQQRGKATTENITGLSQSNRPEQFNHFFSLYANGLDGDEDLVATGILVDVYVNKKPLKEINFSLLSNTTLLTEEAHELLSRQEIRFAPLRQREQTLNGPFSTRERLLLQGMRSIHNQMRYAFEHAQTLPHPKPPFTPIGYAMEFFNTPWQVMGMRFEPSAIDAIRTYTLVCGEDLLPVVVRRVFTDEIADNAADPHPGIHPEDRTDWYWDVDPQTRRVCRTQVCVPLRNTEHIRVSKPLESTYRARVSDRAVKEAFRQAYATHGERLPPRYARYATLPV